MELEYKVLKELLDEQRKTNELLQKLLEPPKQTRGRRNDVK